ncbi:MAG: helix-turn-helix transcriptional regulator, partial [Bacteroidota bacterium]
FNVSLDEIIALGSDFQQLVTHPDDLNRVNHELNKLKAARDENRTVNFFQRLRFHQEDKSGYTLVVTTAKLNLKNNTFVCITNTTDQLPIFSKKVCNALNVKFQTEQYLKAYASLTKREKEIFNLLIEGKSKKEMAVILVRSIRTVEQHVKHIYRKIGVSTKLEAVKMGNFINQAIKHVIYLSLLPWFH